MIYIFVILLWSNTTQYAGRQLGQLWSLDNLHAKEAVFQVRIILKQSNLICSANLTRNLIYFLCKISACLFTTTICEMNSPTNQSMYDWGFEFYECVIKTLDHCFKASSHKLQDLKCTLINVFDAFWKQSFKTDKYLIERIRQDLFSCTETKYATRLGSFRRSDFKYFWDIWA